jgi:hypothetical protein
MHHRTVELIVCCKEGRECLFPVIFLGSVPSVWKVCEVLLSLFCDHILFPGFCRILFSLLCSTTRPETKTLKTPAIFKKEIRSR